MLNDTWNSKKSVLGLATLLPAAIFCVATSAATAGEVEDYISLYDPKIENLHGMQVDRKVASILVTSNGCTKKQDFIVVLDQSQPPVATFIRVVPDFCKRPAHMLPIKFTLEEIGAQVFAVSNLFEPAPSW